MKLENIRIWLGDKERDATSEEKLLLLKLLDKGNKHIHLCVDCDLDRCMHCRKIITGDPRQSFVNYAFLWDEPSPKQEGSQRPANLDRSFIQSCSHFCKGKEQWQKRKSK